MYVMSPFRGAQLHLYAPNILQKSISQGASSSTPQKDATCGLTLVAADRQMMQEVLHWPEQPMMAPASQRIMVMTTSAEQSNVAIQYLKVQI